jgi:hypothetical protein
MHGPTCIFWANLTLVSLQLKLVVLGPHYNSSTHLLANYYGENDLVFSQTPLLGLTRRPEVEVVGAAASESDEGVFSTTVQPPCSLLKIIISLCSIDRLWICGSSCPACEIPAAVAIEKRAGVAVLFVGLHSMQGQQVASGSREQGANGPGMEREGYDRTNLTLPGQQEELIQAVAATGVPTVVVLINSGGIAAEWVYANVPAVLEAMYPGEITHGPWSNSDAA